MKRIKIKVVKGMTLDQVKSLIEDKTPSGWEVAEVIPYLGDFIQIAVKEQRIHILSSKFTYVITLFFNETGGLTHCERRLK